MTPVLYILMRTDLPSMNAGKAMAQASHASNAFIHRMDNKGSSREGINTMVNAWRGETNQGFGTVLVLGASGNQIRTILENAKTVATGDVLAEAIIDPTYPYRVTGEIANVIMKDTIYKGDAEFTLTREEMTCAYVFGDKDSTAGGLVAELKLHP
jgi:peptidyl-tRNA hydrolase